MLGKDRTRDLIISSPLSVRLSDQFLIYQPSLKGLQSYPPEFSRFASNVASDWLKYFVNPIRVCVTSNVETRRARRKAFLNEES